MIRVLSAGLGRTADFIRLESWKRNLVRYALVLFPRRQCQLRPHHCLPLKIQQDLQLMLQRHFPHQNNRQPDNEPYTDPNRGSLSNPNKDANKHSHAYTDGYSNELSNACSLEDTNELSNSFSLAQTISISDNRISNCTTNSKTNCKPNNAVGTKNVREYLRFCERKLYYQTANCRYDSPTW